MAQPCATTMEQEEHDRYLGKTDYKVKHKKCFSINFRFGMASSYPSLAYHAVLPLLIFPSTWKCEQEFLITINSKSKNQNRLSAPGHDFLGAVGKFRPCIDQLVEGKQTKTKISLNLVVLCYC